MDASAITATVLVHAKPAPEYLPDQYFEPCPHCGKQISAILQHQVAASTGQHRWHMKCPKCELYRDIYHDHDIEDQRIA